MHIDRVDDLGPAWDASAVESAYAALRAALDATGDVTQGTVERIEETVLPALASTCVALDDDAGLERSRHPTVSVVTSLR